MFAHLDDSRATEAISEMEDEYQAEFIDDLPDARAAELIGNMDPDDAADIVRDLPYEKAETLLRLMGVEDAAEIRRLLGYKDGTAGGMMTTQFVSVPKTATVADTIEVLRALPEDCLLYTSAFINFTFAQLEFNKRIPPIVKMEHRIGLQSVPVAIVRQLAPERRGICLQIPHACLLYTSRCV